MPMINGVKFACEPCMRGHRSSKCTHEDRILIKVRKPGRPLSSCPHEAGSCSCEVASVAIPKMSSNCPCGSPGSKSKKDEKGHNHKHDRPRAGSHLSSMQPTPAGPPAPAPMQMGYGYPYMVPGMENPELLSSMDPMWQPPQNMGGMNNMNPMNPFAPSPMDLRSPMEAVPPPPPFFQNGPPPPSLSQVPIVKPPSSKKSCCKPEPESTPPGFPGMPSEQLSPGGRFGDFPQNEQRTHRHTSEVYPRKRASLGGYPEGNLRQYGGHGSDGRSTSVPNVPAMANAMLTGMPYGNQPMSPLAEDSQNSSYTIYSAPRYNPTQIQYMNSIRDMHEQAQRREADELRRASQATEHAQKMSGGGCCPPVDPGMPFALPHGAECGCGPNCSCVMCITHPYNSATIEYIRNIHQNMQTPDHSSGEHSPSTQGFAQSVTGVEFPSNGGAGMFDDAVLGSMLEERDMVNMPQGPQLSPSAFIHLDYNLGTCSAHNGACMCGDGCTCVGCLTHGGHNGVALDAGMLTEALPEHPLDEAQVMGSQNDNTPTIEHGAGPGINSDGQVWKTEEGSNGGSVVPTTTS